MSTPTSNSIGVTSLNTSGLGNLGALLGGTKWGGGYGAGVNLTYSFPGKGGAIAYFINGYGEGEQNAFYALTAQERAGVLSALNQWSAVADVDFVAVNDNANVVGDLRFARFDTFGSEAGHAYFPSSNPEAGDVWLKNGAWHPSSNSAVFPGTYHYLTLLHEIGHAVGLKHPFSGANTLPDSYDNYSFTVMSYEAYSGGDTAATFYPTTPMYFDLLAIQKLYGRVPHNAGNTTYTFDQALNYWLTLDDSGGTDRIVSVNSTGVIIDLRPGHWNALGQSVYYPAGGFSESFLVMIGPGTIIENATGGGGPDSITGNAGRNTLTGGPGGDTLRGVAGNDLLQGSGGNDFLYGGAGVDLLIGGVGVDTMRGDTGGDTFFFNTPLGVIDFIVGYSVADDTIRLDASFFPGVAPGVLAAVRFFKGAAASDPMDRVGYQPGSGALISDSNGSLPGGDVIFAYLAPGLAMTRMEFEIVA